MEVRSKEEILLTLDENGCLDNLPFMPEMFAFCGKKFQVYKSAHKTCDTVFPIRGRRVDRTVHLDTRCDGQAHGGCQASCLIFWKEDWLKPLRRNLENGAVPGAFARSGETGVARSSRCTEPRVWACTQAPSCGRSVAKFACQATQLPYATRDLAWWDIRQYLEDYFSGNVALNRLLAGLVYSAYFHVSQAGIGAGPLLRWFYDKFHRIWRGTEFPRKTGLIPSGQPTPTAALNLQPGELVRIKSYQEILRTLNAENKNRGLYFDAEMVPYCGGSYRVLKRVTKIVDEKTGELQEFKKPCFILDSVICQSRYSDCRMFCPRSIYSYWREIWLERISSQTLEEKKDSDLTAASLNH